MLLVKKYRCQKSFVLQNLSSRQMPNHLLHMNSGASRYKTVSSSLSLFSHLRWIKAFHWRKTANVPCTTADYWSRISITWEWTKFISNDLSVPTITSLQFSKLSFAVQLLTYVIIFFSLPQGYIFWCVSQFWCQRWIIKYLLPLFWHLASSSLEKRKQVLS